MVNYRLKKAVTRESNRLNLFSTSFLRDDTHGFHYSASLD